MSATEAPARAGLGLRLSTLLLAPALLWQGRQVRRHTPRLAEPPGAREGTAGSGPPLRLLILGDSAAAGVGAAGQDEALSGRLVTALATRASVRWRLRARTGDSAGAVLRALQQPDEALHCDVALLSVGVNDATALRDPAVFAQRAEAIADWLREHAGARLIVFSGLPPMGRFPALPQPLRWRLGRQADLLDAQLRALARHRTDCAHLPFGNLDDPALMASDGFHPGPAAYAHWAQAAATLIQSRMAG